MRRLKRLAILGVIGGIVFAVWRARSRRAFAPEVGPPSSWPPLRPSEPPVAAAGDLATDEPGTWVPPVDGTCPVSHPVKVGSSGIYHSPGGRFYDRTRPARCYVDAAAADADGYRAAKGS